MGVGSTRPSARQSYDANSADQQRDPLRLFVRPANVVAATETYHQWVITVTNADSILANYASQVSVFAISYAIPRGPLALTVHASC